MARAFSTIAANPTYFNLKTHVKIHSAVGKVSKAGLGGVATFGSVVIELGGIGNSTFLFTSVLNPSPTMGSESFKFPGCHFDLYE
jgi:hypothetical protein